MYFYATAQVTARGIKVSCTVWSKVYGCEGGWSNQLLFSFVYYSLSVCVTNNTNENI